MAHIGLIEFQDSIPLFKFPRLLRYDLSDHAIFTRQGGTSPAPFDSLNLSYQGGDLPQNVDANLSIIKKTMGIRHLLYMNQEHGRGIVCFSEKHLRKTDQILSADAMITRQTGVGLLIKQADCQAVILYDPRLKVAANVHCGWRGNVANILGAVVGRMAQEFGCMAADLLAAIGPSLGPCCAEFKTHKEIFPGSFKPFEIRKNHFDLWAVSTQQLTQAGLKKKHIELAGICTKCRNDLFFSYRGDGLTGRFGTVIVLKK